MYIAYNITNVYVYMCIYVYIYTHIYIYILESSAALRAALILLRPLVLQTPNAIHIYRRSWNRTYQKDPLESRDLRNQMEPKIAKGLKWVLKRPMVVERTPCLSSGAKRNDRSRKMSYKMAETVPQHSLKTSDGSLRPSVKVPTDH